MARSSYRKLSLAALFGALLMGGQARAGTPGVGIVIDAISDEFEPTWTYNYTTNQSNNGLWTTEFRGAPEVLQLIAPPSGVVTDTTMALRMRSIDKTDDSYPGMEDLVSVFYSSTLFGRAVTLAEEPSFVTWAWFPPVSTWPLVAGGSNCFGFRLGARDASLIVTDVSDPYYNPTGEYYPSLWAFRANDGSGHLVARVGDGYVEDAVVAAVSSAGGWYMLGMSWNAQGRTEYYAAPGRVALQASHLIYTDNASDRTMDTVQYHFYSLRFPATGSLSADFLADRCRAFTRALPRVPSLQALTFNRSTQTFGMSVNLGTAGFLYRVEKRASLTTGAWAEVQRYVSNGQPHPFSDSGAGTRMFYHVLRGDETLPTTPLTNARRAALKFPAAAARFLHPGRPAPTWR